MPPRVECPLAVDAVSVDRIFPGTAAFQLYSSMGFPLDLLTLMAEEKVRSEQADDKHSTAIQYCACKLSFPRGAVRLTLCGLTFSHTTKSNVSDSARDFWCPSRDSACFLPEKATVLCRSLVASSLSSIVRTSSALLDSCFSGLPSLGEGLQFVEVQKRKIPLLNCAIISFQLSLKPNCRGILVFFYRLVRVTRSLRNARANSVKARCVQLGIFQSRESDMTYRNLVYPCFRVSAWMLRDSTKKWPMRRPRATKPETAKKRPEARQSCWKRNR